MQQNPKAAVTAGAGAGAMAIALVAGLFGGVAFGTLLLRALIGGLIFAGATIALQLLVRRFLPELMELSGDSGDAEVGRHVDMVVDEDVDLLTPVEEPMSEEEGEDTDPESDSGSDIEDEDLVEEVAEVEEGEEEGTPIPPRVPDVDVSSVDKLPDLDGFVESFQDDGTVEIVEDDDDSVAMPGGQDAETIAKAIKTVMKRDE